MEMDFSQPQKQSALGIIAAAAYATQKVIRAVAIPIFIFIIKADQKAILYSLLGGLVLIIIAFIYAYLEYTRFTFRLDQEKQEFIIHKGILNRTFLTIPLHKIQQVNINQSYLQKLIGVFSLEIDTPGGDAKEVKIQSISKANALHLKTYLLNHNHATDEIQPAPINDNNQAAPFIKISNDTLLKVGFTSNYGNSIFLLMGFVYAIFHNAKDLLKAFDKDDGQVEAAIKSGVSLVSVSILIFALIIILLLTNIIRTFVKNYNFKITKQKQTLTISSGLFATKNTILSPQKVQLTSFSQNYFQKKLNFYNLKLKQAHATNEQEEEDVKKSNLEVPGCSPAEKDQILSIILSKITTENQLFSPNYRFLNLPLFYKVILPALIFFAFWYKFPAIHSYYPLAILYVVMVAVMIYISYKNHSLMVNSDIIIKKAGIWDITHQHLLPHKIQAITTFQYPWHKTVDVGHVNLHTAAGVIHFKYGNYTEIKKLVNYWLYQVESGSKEWM